MPRLAPVVGPAGAGRLRLIHAMRPLRHFLLVTAIMTIALLAFVAGQARAADPASVVSQIAAANLPATPGDPPAAPAQTGSDISPPASTDTTGTSSTETVQTTGQSTDPPGTPAPAAPPPPPSPPPAPPTTPVPPVPAVPADPPAAPVANNTTQVIEQVQVSGCLSHCEGGSQTQVASQQNQTVQAVSGAPHPAPVSAPKSAPSSSRIKQVQVGCVSACFGTTSKGSGAQLGPHELSELMLALGMANSVHPTPVSGAIQNTASQTSSQLQIGSAGPDSQTQGAAQTNLTIQALPADLIANGTTQAIAQIQIGCLFYCHGTSQYQLATQSNATVEVAPSASTVATATASGVVNVTDQLIWQLQIGCLMWCWDATQDQSASTDDVLVGLPAPSPPPPAQPSDPVQPSDPGPSAPSEPVPSDPAAPPGVAATLPAVAPPLSASPSTAGGRAPTPVRSAIRVGGVVSGSVTSGAWSETLSATGWSVTETAPPAHRSSRAPRVPAPGAPRSAASASPVGVGSFAQQIVTSSSYAVGPTRAAGHARSSRAHRGATKSAGAAVIGAAPVDDGADEGVAIGLAAFALIALLAGGVAWRRRIG